MDEEEQLLFQNDFLLSFSVVSKFAYTQSNANRKYLRLYALAGPRVTVRTSPRWAACGAVSVSSTTALFVRLCIPGCEPQNKAAYVRGKL
ncbi:hypothetical protein WN943_003138 [Citrus x changshan-huyou]